VFKGLNHSTSTSSEAFLVSESDRLSTDTSLNFHVSTAMIL